MEQELKRITLGEFQYIAQHKNNILQVLEIETLKLIRLLFTSRENDNH